VRFLIDEMLPPRLAAALAALGHDAVHVRDVGLGNADDADILGAAIRDSRVMVTENIADFMRLTDGIANAGDPATAVVMVRRGRQPGGVLADRLARALDAWARMTPTPWHGPHWVTFED
jgi:predicted nuclease of predicted toxin-antitoxin system